MRRVINLIFLDHRRHQQSAGKQIPIFSLPRVEIDRLIQRRRFSCVVAQEVSAVEGRPR